MEKRGPKVVKSSSILDAFEKSFTNRPPPSKRVGTPLFLPKDVGRSAGLLDHMIRFIMVDSEVTGDYFTGMHRKYASIALGVVKERVAQHKTNLLKALRKGNITFKVFAATLRVLGYSVEDIVFHLTSEDGTKYVVSLSQAIKTVADAAESDD